LVVNSGGRLLATGATFAPQQTVTLNSGSSGTVQYCKFQWQFAINSGMSFAIDHNNFQDVTANGIIASGTSTATIDMTNNHWGTSAPAGIGAKILAPAGRAARATVNFQPVLSLPPTQTAADPVNVLYKAAAQNVTLTATVTGPGGEVVSLGAVTFTILDGGST